MAGASEPSRWTLSPEALRRFLDLLDPDVVRAGQRYEALRQKLIRLFEWRSCVFAEDLADQTINRVVRRIEEGVSLDSAGVFRYAAAVANHIFLEHLRKTRRARPNPGDADGPPWRPGRHETTDLRLALLEGSLARLSAEERGLIVRYYAGDRGTRIRNRRQLAAELELSPGHLRIKAYRLRARLEASIEQEMRGHVSRAGEVEDEGTL